MASPAQALLAFLWWGPLRWPFEPLARRLWSARRILAGPLRGVDFDGGLAQRLGIYELQVQDVLCRLLESGDVVYDVGGHRGFFGLLAARRIGPEGRVFIFEPVAESRRAVETAVDENGFTGISTVAAAVSDREGEAELFLHEGSTTASLIRGDAADRRVVPLITLDAFAAEHRPPNLVKIDVEGAEDRVLRGARTLLESVRPRLIIELHDADVETAVRGLLAEAHYDIRSIPPRSSRREAYPRHILAQSRPAR